MKSRWLITIEAGKALIAQGCAVRRKSGGQDVWFSVENRIDSPIYTCLYGFGRMCLDVIGNPQLKYSGEQLHTRPEG